MTEMALSSGPYVLDPASHSCRAKHRQLPGSDSYTTASTPPWVSWRRKGRTGDRFREFPSTSPRGYEQVGNAAKERSQSLNVTTHRSVSLLRTAPQSLHRR